MDKLNLEKTIPCLPLANLGVNCFFFFFLPLHGTLIMVIAKASGMLILLEGTTSYISGFPLAKENREEQWQCDQTAH